MSTLDDRCRAMLAPEPVTFVQDAPGHVRFASDHLPSRAMIEIQTGIIYGVDMRIEPASGLVTIVDSTGRSATWRRAAIALNGAWICDLVPE